MRVVIDTNVFLSALLHGRGTTPVVSAFLSGRFQLVTSEILLEELMSVLHRPEWREVLASSETSELVSIIREAALFVRASKSVNVCRDPEDNALLECSLAGRVDYLVTGDRDLLVLNPFHGIRIVRPAEFLKLVVE